LSRRWSLVTFDSKPSTNTLHQKQSIIKQTAWKNLREGWVQGFVSGGLPIGESYGFVIVEIVESEGKPEENYIRRKF